MSPVPTEGELRRAEIQAWWTLVEHLAWAVLRILLAVFGVVLVASQNFWLTADQWQVRALLIAGGFVCMGPAVAAGLAQVVQAMRGRSNNE